MKADSTSSSARSGRLVTVLVVALAASGGFWASRFLDQPEATPPVSVTDSALVEEERPPIDEAALVEMLTANAEQIAARELPASNLEEETWRLESPLTRARLETWLDLALPRVGGTFLPSPPPDPAEGADVKTAELTYYLDVPQDSRLRLYLAMDALGQFTAPEYADTTSAPAAQVLAGQAEPELPPADLEPAATAMDGNSTIRLILDADAAAPPQ